MWCPNCKAEYRSGMTTCPECGSPLNESALTKTDTAPMEEPFDKYQPETMQSLQELSEGNHTYVEKGIKYDDMKSTAYSFLLVGVCGFLFLVLIFIGIIPIHLAAYMKYMMGAVMGGMFLVFLIVGIRSYLQLGELKSQMQSEQQDIEKAKDWFLSGHTAQTVDTISGISATDELQQKYFLRSKFIKQSLYRQFPSYTDAFLDYLTELIYELLYPQENFH